MIHHAKDRLNEYGIPVEMNNGKKIIAFLQKSYDQFPLIPFRTLAMIQEANGEQLVFLELFNCLKKVESSDYCLKDLNFRLIIVIEDKVFIKKAAEEKLYVGQLGYHNKEHFIILLKNSKQKTEDHFLEKITAILVQKNIGYEKLGTRDDSLLEESIWAVDQVLKVNLTVLMK